MQILITICIAFTILFLLVPALCWFATMLVTSNAKTPGEAAVRGLYYTARWLLALADGANAFVNGYREVMKDVTVDPSCEQLRRLEEEKQKRVEAEKVRKHVRRWKKANGVDVASGMGTVKAGITDRVLKFVFG